MKSRRKRSGFPWYRIVSVAAVLVLPLVYGFLYLWAFWDPYAALKKLPVAVVNLDRGSVRKGESYNLGARLSDKLKKNTALEWHITGKADAARGLSDRKYYAVITIPEAFSGNVLSAETDNPQTAHLELTVREASSFMAAKFADTATMRLVSEVNREAGEEYWHNVFVSLREIGGKLGDAQVGANTLASGLDDLADGNRKIHDGLNSAASGSRDLESGLGKMVDGSGDIKNGLSTAKNGASALVSGLTAIDGGISTLGPGIGQLQSGVSQIRGGITQSKTAVDMASALLADPSKTDTVRAILSQTSAGLGTLDAGAASVSAGLSGASIGVQQLSSGSKAALAGIGSLDSGLATLYTGASDLNGALNTAHTGAGTLTRGLDDLLAGNTEMADGIGKAKDGAIELRDGLADGKNEVLEKASPTTEDARVAVLSAPVSYTSSPVAKVPNNGTGFAPYFIPLALWVGAMAAFIIFPNASFNPRTVAVFSAIGAGQSVLLNVLLMRVLGLEVQSATRFIAFGIAYSWCVMIIQAVVNKLLGDGGKFVNILALMLQLTGSAGSYPLETAPAFFRAINPYLPMTYAVKILRELISGGDLAFAWSNTRVILYMGVMFFVLRLGLYGRDKHYAKNKTH